MRIPGFRPLVLAVSVLSIPALLAACNGGAC